MARPRNPAMPLKVDANWRWEEIETAAAIYHAEISDDDEGDLEALRDVLTMIAERLHCTISRVRDRFNHCGPTFSGVREASKDGLRRVSNNALQERDQRRAALDRRDLTGTLFGDPAPGFSALDRRRA
jgi:hypothetical protein